MGEQERLVERGAGIAHGHGTGHAGDRGKTLVRKGQRDQSRSGLGHGQAELTRDVIGQTGCAHFGDGFAAGGKNEIAAGEGLAFAFAVNVEVEAVSVMGKPAEFAAQPQRATGLGQFIKQHRDDLCSLAVAKQLAEGFFMPGDAVAGHEVYEIPLGVTRERGFGEMRVFRQKVLWLGPNIGKVAAPAAGNADFLAG